MTPFTKLRDAYYPITTVVGSSRFKEEIEEINRHLVSMGHQVWTMHIFGHADGVDHHENYEDLKRMFDAAYMDKIERSDNIFVANVDQYIGMGAMDEILYAISLKKKIYFLEPIRNQECLSDLRQIFLQENGFPLADMVQHRHTSPIGDTFKYWELCKVIEPKNLNIQFMPAKAFEQDTEKCQDFVENHFKKGLGYLLYSTYRKDKDIDVVIANVGTWRKVHAITNPGNNTTVLFEDSEIGKIIITDTTEHQEKVLRRLYKDFLGDAINSISKRVWHDPEITGRI